MPLNLKEIYSGDKTFLDYFSDDLQDNNVWYNPSEFARYHDVNGVKLLSVFATNDFTYMLRKAPVEKDTPGINQAGCVLYCRVHDVLGFKAEQVIRIDGKIYQVKNANLIQEQVWRVELMRIQE